MSKSTITMKSVANGKTYRIPSDLYEIMTNEKYDTPQKAFMFISWYKEREASQFGLGDKHVESMVLNMFKNLLPSRQEYRNFIRMYEKRYGGTMKVDEWEEEYKDEDILKQIMANIVRKSMEDGKNTKEIQSIVEERMEKYGKTDMVKKMIRDPEVVKELIIKREKDLERLKNIKQPKEEDGKPVVSDRKGKKILVV